MYPVLPLAASIARAVLLLALTGAVRAQSTPLTVPAGAPYRVHSWDTGSGLPQNSVLALRQTADGAMWAATFGGLCRFDGRQWSLCPGGPGATVSDPRVTALHEDADGTLWVGSELGVLGRVRGGAIEGVAVLAGGGIAAIARREDGALLCANDADVFVLDAAGGCAPLYPEPLPHGLGLLRLPGGEIWHCGMNGVHRLAGASPECLLGEPCFDASATADGKVYLATGRGLVVGRGGVLRDLVPASEARGPIQAVFATRHGRIWFATKARLHRLAVDGANCDVALQCQGSVHALAEDSSGGLWVGLVGAGVARLVASELYSCVLPMPRVPDAVLGDGRGGWFFGSRDGLYHETGGRVACVEAVGSQPVRGLLLDPDGSLWIGLVQGFGRLATDGSFRLVEGSTDVGVVRAIERDASGALVVGTDDGAWRLAAAGGAFGPVPGAASLRGGTVRCVRRDLRGNLWIAGSRTLLRLSPGGEISACWRLGTDLPAGDVRAVLPRADGRVWLGIYGGGFVAIDGDRTIALGEEHGLLDGFVCTVTPFGNDWLVGGNRGAYVLDPDALDRVADGLAPSVTYRTLTGPGGLPVEANGGVQPSSATQGHTAAICCVGGLLRVDLDALGELKPQLTCSLRVVAVGDQRIEGGDPMERLQAVANRTVVVQLSAVDLDQPTQIRYRWRLVPGDGEWRAPTREATVTFTLPAAGDYRFEAQALSVAGRPGPHTARLELHIAPQYWERPSFWLLVATGMGLLVWSLVLFGSRQVRRRAAHLRQIVGERTAELVVARERLEERVAERTTELQQALRQLADDHEERARLQWELQKLQRMESLGQLAGGVAHDFNNLLTIVLGYEDLLARQLQDRPDLLALVGHIRDAGERGRRLTHHLLAVASRQTVMLTDLDLTAHVGRQRVALQAVLGPTIRLDLDLPREELPMRAAPSQIEQILMNLCVNARDAMPGGGTVRIAVARRGVNVELGVEDTGSGMAPEVLQRAFEPFFTTKPADRGTGLGLATVYGITKQLQGEVTVASLPGEGTRFQFVFPLVEAFAAEEPVVTVPAPASTPLRVLLIEDQNDVRRALRSSLEQFGCHVIAEAADGHEAVRHLARHRGRVDVVLSDVQIPGPTGLMLVRALRSECPGVPIVFLTGHAGSWQTQSECRELGIEMLPKPPDLGELLAALHRACAGTSGPGASTAVSGSA